MLIWRPTKVKDTDYQIQVRANAQSSVAIIAPHGGEIEKHTSEIARAIAGEDFNLYMFEGNPAFRKLSNAPPD